MHTHAGVHAHAHTLTISAIGRSKHFARDSSWLSSIILIGEIGDQHYRPPVQLVPIICTTRRFSTLKKISILPLHAQASSIWYRVQLHKARGWVQRAHHKGTRGERLMLSQRATRKASTQPPARHLFFFQPLPHSPHLPPMRVDTFTQQAKTGWNWQVAVQLGDSVKNYFPMLMFGARNRLQVYDLMVSYSSSFCLSCTLSVLQDIVVVVDKWNGVGHNQTSRDYQLDPWPFSPLFHQRRVSNVIHHLSTRMSFGSCELLLSTVSKTIGDEENLGSRKWLLWDAVWESTENICPSKLLCLLTQTVHSVSNRKTLTQLRRRTEQVAWPQKQLP